MSALRPLLPLLCCLAAFLIPPQAHADSAVELLSLSTGGKQGFDDATDPSVSADGRIVAFVAPDDSIGKPPGNSSGSFVVFVRDRITGLTTRITDKVRASAAGAAVGADNDCVSPAVNGSGRFVVYASTATNLVSQPNNGVAQIYFYDRQNRRTKLISARPNGKAGNGASSFPSISGGGRFVTFLSLASDLVSGDTNGGQDVFVRDLSTGKTERVNLKPDGSQSTPFTASGTAPRMSFDGRYVAWSSASSDLVATDQNGNVHDIFVRDRRTRTTTLASVIVNQPGFTLRSFQPEISANGRFVAFGAFANALSDGSLTSLEGNGTVHVFDRQTNTTVFSRANCSTPRLSADGRFVAFVEKSATANSEVKIFDRQTNRNIFGFPRQSASGNSQTTPSLSANGQLIVFASDLALTAGDANGVRDIFATPLADTLTLAVAAAYLPETTSNIVATVNRFGTSLGAVTVKYNVSAPGDTAVAGVDYNFPAGGSTGTLSWPDGDTTARTVTIPLINRPLTVDGYRVFTFALQSPSSGVQLGTAMEKIVIRDPASAPVEDARGHALRIARIVTLGTSWNEKIFRGEFTLYNPGRLPSFTGELDYVYQPVDPQTRRPSGAPVVVDTVTVDSVPARGKLTFFSTADLITQFNGSQLDGKLYVELHELKPAGGRVIQDTAFAASYDTTDGVTPPAGGSTMASTGINAPGFTQVRVQSVTVNPPAQILENSTATFTATVRLTDGSTVSATPAWRTNAFFISQAGTLTTGEVTRNIGITITATVNRDGVSTSGSRVVTITNVPATPVITTVASAFASLNKPYSFRITAVHEPDTFDAIGLPDGLVVNTTTGVISGTPTVDGTFAIELRAINEIGTGTKAFSLTVAPPSPLTVSLGGTGSGDVVGIGALGDVFPRQEIRDVGLTFTLTAFPAAGSLFEGWHGGITSSTPRLIFVMTPNLALEARFVINPFLTHFGIYSGLVTSSPAAHGSTGAFRFNITTAGRLTGVIVYGGRNFPLNIKLSPVGFATKQIARAGGLSPLTVTVQLNVAPGSAAITGTITDGVIASTLSGQHVVAGGALAGRYTVLFPPVGDSTDLPAGAGFATLVVGTNGSARLIGRLPDSTPLAIGSNLISGNTLPLYLPLYVRAGSISGSASFVTLPDSDISASLSWFKPVRPTDPFYPDAWPSGLAITMRGQSFTALPAINAIFTAHGGALLGDQTQALSVDTTGKVTLTAPVLPRFSLRFVPTTGLFSGSFLDPFSNTVRVFNGAVLQGTTEVQGNFKGNRQVGLVEISGP